MPIIPWKPFGDLDRMFDDDFFLPVIPKMKMSMPAMDLYETEKEVVAELSAPDIDPDKVNISVENQVIRISYNEEEKKEEKKKGYYYQEIRKGSFERAARLPCPVDEDKIDANYEKGMLKIIMPKVAPKVKSVKVKVKTENKSKK